MTALGVAPTLALIVGGVTFGFAASARVATAHRHPTGAFRAVVLGLLTVYAAALIVRALPQ